MQLGNKLRRLRLRHGLTQQELATRCDLSKGFISQLESDQTSPSIATLVDILEVLGTDLRDFFSEPVEEKLVFGPEDIFVSTDEAGIATAWLVPNSQKNDMEPILIELPPDAATPVDDPHAGEEFGYVLSGAIRLHVGERVQRARKGESFYYRATQPHSIENAGKTPARILWVATPPSF
nr:XRE family transcriptional regulator [bacterium]